ncbi:MAG: MnhB domain-containing protein [Lachnospiraceae bacterium]|nr:MnhB domain-containing protein [Lachnospiraceae bacterium]MBR2531438.1 MnhB domain-containing protein [Lachnospiraceae bacterium]
MKFKEGITEKNVIIKCGADKFLPFALTFGLYIILFGTISPGGGFQGGVCVASGALLLYLGYGYNIATKAISTEALRVNEAIGASLYVILGLLGIAFGANFCRNIFYNMGAVGDFLSAGTITFMGYAVGYKVLSGVGFLLLLMLGLLAPDPDDADAAPAVEAIEAAEAPAELPLEEAVDAAVATETVKEGVTE